MDQKEYFGICASLHSHGLQTIAVIKRCRRLTFEAVGKISYAVLPLEGAPQPSVTKQLEDKIWLDQLTSLLECSEPVSRKVNSNLYCESLQKGEVWR